MFQYTYIYSICNHQWFDLADRTRVQWAETHRSLIFIANFPQKSPIIHGSFSERDLQLKASSASLPPCSGNHPVAVIRGTFKKKSSWVLEKKMLVNSEPEFFFEVHDFLKYMSFSIYVILLNHRYGVATISRLLKIIGLFCRT